MVDVNTLPFSQRQFYGEQKRVLPFKEGKCDPVGNTRQSLETLLCVSLAREMCALSSLLFALWSCCIHFT